MRPSPGAVDDDGWIRTLLLAQWIFHLGFFLLYLVSRRAAHHLVGHLEQEAVLGYTLYQEEVEAGRSANVAAPAVAGRY